MDSSKDKPAHGNGASENGDDPAHEDEFDRFKALTEKLVRVPKTELDEKRKKKTKT